jgi:hypothetical protein
MALYLSDDSVTRKSESSNAEDKSAYVYRWTHVTTGKWYVGSRTAKRCHPNDGYICSSREVKPLIQSNPSEWRREILATGESDAMYNLESNVLQESDARNNPMSFNKHNNDGKFCIAGKPRNEDVKSKISNSLLGKKQSEETKTKKSKVFSGSGNAFYGKKHKEETKKILRNLYLGTTRSEEIKKKISETLTGVYRPKSVKDKISEGVKNLLKIECVHCGKKCPPATHGRWHGDNCKHGSIK